MRLFTLAAVVLLLALLSVADGKKKKHKGCEDGRWGEDCENVCGHCMGGCRKLTGKCRHGCDPGWMGKDCIEPVCKQDCGPGICVAPDICGACGDINLAGPNCEDIRITGLFGSLIALGVISISIYCCGLGSAYYKHSRRNKVGRE